MPFARKNLTIQDGEGNIVNGATVQFRNESTLALPQVYSDKAGTTALGNPYVAADGRNAGAYLIGGYYRITATLGSLTVEWRDEPVGLAQGTDFGGGELAVESFTGATGTISQQTTHAIVKRAAPATTGLSLPDASARNGRRLSIADNSTSITDHTITLTPYQASQKIMLQSTWPMYSNAANLAGLSLDPIVDPDDASNYIWVIAP